MSFFASYASSAGQAALLNINPPSVKWLDGLYRPDGSKKYIEIAPPYSGTGILRLKTSATVTLENKGLLVAKVRLVIGVDNPIAGPKPMFPYLGVSHGPADALTEYLTLGAGQAMCVVLWRWDIVDEALESDQPIPGWPNWKVQGKPLLSLCGNNDTPANPVWYRDCQFDCVEIP